MLFISNFVLELHNTSSMKKTVTIFVIAVMVVVSAVVWIFESNTIHDLQELLMLIGLFIIVGFAILRGFTRIRSHRQQEPTEDEYTRKVMNKTAALSYYISIYFWLLLMYLSDKIQMEMHSMIGVGIMGMALIFFFCWLGFKIFGLKNG